MQTPCLARQSGGPAQGQSQPRPADPGKEIGLTRYAGVATLAAVPISPGGSAMSIRGQSRELPRSGLVQGSLSDVERQAPDLLSSAEAGAAGGGVADTC